MINIPTIAQLKSSIKASIEGAMNVTIQDTKNFLNVWIGQQAAKMRLMYLQLNFIQRQITPDTADLEINGGSLEKWGRIKINRNKFPATSGLYTIQVTGTIGATINASQTFKSNDDSSNPGLLYILDNEFELSSSPDTIQVRALTLGLAGRLIVGDKLTSTSPVVGLDRGATVTAEDEIPIDEETDSDYRDKILQAFRLEPQGGAVGDYRLWSFDAVGVKTVYPYASNSNSGEVDVYVEGTSGNGGSVSTTILEDVEDVLELDPDVTKDINERGRRPLGVIANNVLSCTAVPIDIQIIGYQGLTSEVETTIEDTLTAYMKTVRPFIAGADILEKRNDVLTSNKLGSQIINASPEGAFFANVTFSVDSFPQTQYQFLGGIIPYLNSISYI
jgi:uncharacterized phage protein gp47/JayE